MKLSEITIRDPYILPVAEEQRYYLFGTTDRMPWSGPGEGFDCYRSDDLKEWEGPIAAWRPPERFWGTTQFWAPEVHAHDGAYYLFATFKAEKRYRGTEIFRAEKPEGPFVEHSCRPVTPEEWECLDGTLHIEPDGTPYLVFCHEWVQIHNGAICAVKLSPDLRRAISPPLHLFSATDAPWVKRKPWPEAGDKHPFPTYVTDGPYLHRTKAGDLILIWSSFGESGYAIGTARSESGTIAGPWHHESEALWSRDGGHGMIFPTFDGRLYLTFHMPNTPGEEHPVLVEIREENAGLNCC